MELTPERVRQLWNFWGIRQVIMLSLLCQIILTIFGSKRNRSKSSWMRIILWFAYMTSDWAAKFLLGTMVSVDEDSNGGSISTESIQLRAFWASFLLLHLGGPDTIAAYSLEDNELWLRSLLGMVVYVGVALYILLTYWSNNLLGYISIPMFFVGTVKYVERIWLLRSKSKEHLRDHSLFSKRLLEGLGLPDDSYEDLPREVGENSLFQAYDWYAKFLCEFFLKAEIPDELDKMYYSRYFPDGEAENVFRLVQIELALVYQVLYTKATVFSSLLGILIRSICFILLVATLVIFLTVHVIAPKGSHQIVDIVITCFLLIGAIFVEVCSFVILFSSEWRKLWLLHLNMKRKSSVPSTKFEKAVDSLALFMTRYPSLEMDPRNWSLSEKMGQYNLIDSCLKKATSHRCGVRRLLTIINEKLEKHLNVSWVKVTSDLRQLMFDHHEDKDPTGRARWSNLCEKVFAKWRVPEQFRWNRGALAGLDQIILVWHIATDICYNTDDDFVRQLNRQVGESEDDYSVRKKRERTKKGVMDICMSVSNYMLYLYVMHPSMVSRSIETEAYRKTYDGVLLQFNELEGRDKKGMICKKLLECEVDIERHAYLRFGIKLARELQELRDKEGWDDNNKWEMICDVWGEMLAYVATQGDWEGHLHQLRRGGELITYMRLLIFHSSDPLDLP